MNAEALLGLALGILTEAVRDDRDFVLAEVAKFPPHHLALVRAAAETLIEATA